MRVAVVYPAVHEELARKFCANLENSTKGLDLLYRVVGDEDVGQRIGAVLSESHDLTLWFMTGPLQDPGVASSAFKQLSAQTHGVVLPANLCQLALANPCHNRRLVGLLRLEEGDYASAAPTPEHSVYLGGFFMVPPGPEEGREHRQQIIFPASDIRKFGDRLQEVLDGLAQAGPRSRIRRSSERQAIPGLLNAVHGNHKRVAS